MFPENGVKDGNGNDHSFITFKSVRGDFSFYPDQVNNIGKWGFYPIYDCARRLIVLIVNVRTIFGTKGISRKATIKSGEG